MFPAERGEMGEEAVRDCLRDLYFLVPTTNSFGTMADELQVPGAEPSEQCCGSETQLPLFMSCILKTDDVGQVAVYVSSEIVSLKPVPQRTSSRNLGSCSLGWGQ